MHAELLQSCSTLCDPINCNLPGSSVHGILQARILELVVKLSSVQFSCSVVPNSLRPHGLQHSRPPCLSLTPRVYSNSCPLSQWCHPTISSSVIPFSSCIKSFPASWSFPFWISSSHQVAKVLEFQLQHQSLQWIFRTDLDGLVGSPYSPRGSQASSPTPQFKSNSILQHSAFFIVQLSHPYMATGKTIVLTKWTFFGKVMSLLFNMLSRLVIGFLPRSNCLLIPWLESPSAVILDPKKKKKSLSLFPLFPHLFAVKWWDWKHWS